MTETIVETAGEAAGLEHGAAIVLEPLREFCDAAGLGSGELRAEPIGDGHSNLTFLVRRGDESFVLRRPPRGELSASANDVLRESNVLEALAGTAVPVPEVLARCEDAALIGAPFFLMSRVPGTPINEALPADLDGPDAPRRITDALVDTLVELHDIGLERSRLGEFGKPSGYLERQLRRFGSLLEQNATRPLPDLELTAEWLAANLPDSSDVAFVHGDYRLGNMMFAAPLRLAAVLDWEMATVGDPLADLGYCTVTWSRPGDEQSPLFALSALTAQARFPGRDDLARRYAEASGRSVEALPWYQVLAIWKAAIFFEGSYRRFREGASGDALFASLDRGVPDLAAMARSWIARFEQGPSDKYAYDYVRILNKASFGGRTVAGAERRGSL